MFGNRIGWGLAAVLTSAVLVVVYYMGVGNRISAPSEGIVAANNVSLNLLKNPARLDEIVLPVDPSLIVPDMNKEGDAAPIYRKAIALYLDDKYKYEDVIDPKTRKPKTVELAELPAIMALVEARPFKSMDLFKSKLEDVINYGTNSKTIDPLFKIGKSAAKLGMHIMDEDKPKALQLGEAIFSLGYKLAQERIRWQQFDNGVELMRDGAYLIEKTDASRTAAKSVDESMRQLLVEKMNPMWMVVGAIDQNVMGRTAGDVFHLALNSKEQMWRIEAILKLGQYRHNAGEGGRGADQRWAAIKVRRIADDTKEPPAIREAAKAARDLTLDQYRTIGAHN